MRGPPRLEARVDGSERASERGSAIKMGRRVGRVDNIRGGELRRKRLGSLDDRSFVPSNDGFDAAPPQQLPRARGLDGGSETGCDFK